MLFACMAQLLLRQNYEIIFLSIILLILHKILLDYFNFWLNLSCHICMLVSLENICTIR